MNLNMNAWLSAAWWRTPLATQQGRPGSEFDKPVSLLTMMLTGIAGVVVMGLIPIVATAYVEYLRFTESQGGYVLAAEMSGYALGTLLISTRVHIWNRRTIALSGLVILLLGNLICLGLHSFDLMLIARLSIGLGGGGVAGVMAASIAASGSPDRFFGFYTVLTLSTVAVLMSLTPVLLASFGIKGLLSLLAFMTLPALCLVRNFPEFTLVSKQDALEKKTLSWREMPLNLIIIVSVATLAYYVGTGGVWPYMSQVGRSMGFTMQETGNLLAVAQLFGVAGALVPVFLGVRLGRIPPVTFSLLVSVSCLLALLTLDNKLVYALVVQFYMFVWLLFFPYLMGIVSELDPLGRLAGISYALQSVGFAVGPALAALLLTRGGYDALFYLGIVCYVMTLVLLLPLALKQGAGSR